MAVRLLFVHALTSIHPGTGQGVGTIDLPIARERATNLPLLPGSSLKGCIRASDKTRSEELTTLAFGSGKQQGHIRFSDARLLLLPVRAVGSTFVWATSPYVLQRFQRDCVLLDAGTPPTAISSPGEDQADVADISVSVTLAGKPKLILEDLDFDAQANLARPWAEWIGGMLFQGQPDWLQEFLRRFVVISDASFDYLCEFATEVNAHIKIGDDGIVEDGALWYEETLPAETVLVSALDVRNADTIAVIPKWLRLGGNETTGQGLARLVLGGAN